MNLLKLIPLLLLITTCSISNAQSKTTQQLQEKYSDSFSLFFYNNTLRMINQEESKEFDEIIKDIEKMRFLMIKKTDNTFDYNQMVRDYKSELFEEAMTSRHQGKNFDVFVRDNAGKVKAMLVLINDDENLFILDILGSIPLDKVTKLYSMMDESGDIGSKIQSFVSKDKDKKVE